MPIQPLQIVEILERSEQGVTRPFLCRCSDDQFYYVKGQGAGRRSLLCKWFVGHLAQTLGLPLPPFAIVQAPEDLIHLYPEGSDLGVLPAFGSRVVPHTQELTVSHLHDVPAHLQRDVLMFDWWTHNPDRTLTTRSGNPNLRWDTDNSQLTVTTITWFSTRRSMLVRSAKRTYSPMKFPTHFKILWND